jgi:hypothetical protein
MGEDDGQFLGGKGFAVAGLRQAAGAGRVAENRNAKLMHLDGGMRAD